MTEEKKQLVEKLIIEEKNLYEKIIKLIEFILHSKTFDTLDQEDQTDLTRQLDAMIDYNQVLEDRILRIIEDMINPLIYE